MTLTLVVLGASREECEASSHKVMLADELVFVSNPAARWGGLGTIWNHYLETALSDVLGIVHADTVLSPPIISRLTDIAVSSLAGVVGSTWERTVWSDDIQSVCPVTTLDSCALFVPRSISLRFDTATFDSFHCCVEDFCLQAAEAGWHVVVVPGSAGHPLPMKKLHAGESVPRIIDGIGRRWPVGQHKMYLDRLKKKWADKGVYGVFTT